MQEGPVVGKLPRIGMLVCGAALAVLGTLGLPFWGASSAALMHLTYVPMAASSALLFLVVGPCLFFAACKQATVATELCLRVVGSLAVLGGAAVLLQLILGLSTDFEQYLGAGTGPGEAFQQARMSPLTAVNFILGGCALWGLSLRRRSARLGGLAGILATGSAAITVTVVLGYVYDTPLLYGEPVIPMALATALAFLALDLAVILMAGPAQLPLRPFLGGTTRARLLRAFMPTAVIVVMVNSVLYHVVAKEVINQALFNALSTLAAGIATTLVITYVARVISRDIDQANAARVSAQSEAQLNERNFLGFMDNGPFTAFIKDSAGRYLYVNHVFASMYRLTPETIVGKTNAEIGFPEASTKEIQAVEDQVIRTKQKSTRTVIYPHLDGVERHWHVVKFPHIDRFGNTVVGGICIDITELVKAEASKKEAHEQLLQAYKFAALGEMAGNIAHEINNPLAIIDGKAKQLCDILAEPEIDAQMARRFGESISETALRLVKIVNGLRTMSRRADKDPFTRKPVRDLIEDTVALCAAKLKLHEVELTVEVPPLPLMIDCRPSEISQVLMNLISNAHDAIETLAERWIKVTVEDTADFLCISVTDSGPGVPKEIQDRITEPFFTTKSEGKGTGLGLSISKGFIIGHGGNLVLDRASKHTRFVVQMPKVQTLSSAS